MICSAHQKSYCHLYKIQASELQPINGVTLGEYVAKSHAIRMCQGMESKIFRSPRSTRICAYDVET